MNPAFLRDPSVLHYRRGLILMAAGAVLGLVLAAYGLFTARGTSTLIVPPEDVALVNQQPIARSDYYAQLRTLYDVGPQQATPAQRKKVLDDMIREELFVQRGTELDVASADPAVRGAMVSAVEQESATDALTSMPGDAKLLAFFNAHKDRYTSDGYMEMRDIVFPAGTSSAALAAARAASADAAVARFGGHDSGKVAATEFYFAAPLHLGPALAKAAEALSDGAVSAPLPAPDGVHLIFMQRNFRPQVLDFTKAKARVLGDYRQDAVQRMLAHEEVFLRERANILIAGDLK